MRPRFGSRPVFLFLALGLIVAVVVGTAPGEEASAAPGQLLSTINRPQGCGGIGVAFDGTHILYTCAQENLRGSISGIFKTNLNGDDLGKIEVSVPLDAIAWDPNEGVLWGGNLGRGGEGCQIWAVDLQTGTTSLRFTYDDGHGGCEYNPFWFFDGLTVDVLTDTLYLSPDVHAFIHHFSKTGVPLPDDPLRFWKMTAGRCPSLDFVNGGCGNSGLTIGLDGTLYAGTDGAGQIFALDPHKPALKGVFAGVSGRDEDLECGPLFRKPDGKYVETILSADFLTPRIDVLEAPAGTCVLSLLVVTPNILDGANGVNYEAGGLDFANQARGTRSAPQYLTLRNAGTAPMRFRRITFPPDFGRTRDTTCVGFLKPGAECRIGVEFAPSQVAQYSSLLEIVDTAIGSPHRVLLRGAGTRAALANRPAAEQPVEDRPLGNCPALLLKFAGWRLIGDGARRELEGQVVQAHVTTQDFPGNHETMDYNFFVHPDGRHTGILASPANFQTGDPYEFGLMEVEWEQARGPAGRPPAGGFPRWAWPAQGDRIYVLGSHILDCGHGRPLFFGRGFRSEIHPPRLVVTYRNAALTPFAGASGRLGSWYDFGEGPTWATRADVFGSSYGGLAIQSIYGTLPTLPTIKWSDWWQPVNDRDYSFVIKAPPKPSPGAELSYAVLNRPIPGAVAPPELRFTPLRDDQGNEFGYRVTVRFSRVLPDGGKDRLLAIGATIHVGWKNAQSLPAARPDPTVRRFRVTVQEVRVLQTLTTHWAMYAYVNDKSSSLLTGATNSLHEPYLPGIRRGARICAAGRGCPFTLSGNVFEVGVVAGQPLHLQLRGVSQHLRLGNHTLAGIVERIYADGDPALPPAGASRVVTLPAGGRLAVGPEEIDEECRRRGPCFEVTYEITRLQ